MPAFSVLKVIFPLLSDLSRLISTVKAFTIPAQPELQGDLLTLTAVSLLKNHKLAKKKVNIKLKKNQHLLLKGPNGIGKSTLLEKLATSEEEGMVVKEGTRIGYYRQDFSTLNFEDTVYKSLAEGMEVSGYKLDEQFMRQVAASFLLTGDIIQTKIGSLSEGQKGLVAFARLVLERPGLLILDEPTNHINFRHLPVIAKALDQYQGAMIIVSHVPEFLAQIRIDETLDLEK